MGLVRVGNSVYKYNQMNQMKDVRQVALKPKPRMYPTGHGPPVIHEATGAAFGVPESGKSIGVLCFNN